MLERRIIFPKQATVNYVDNFLRAVRDVRGVEGETFVFDLSRTTELSSVFVCFICGLVDLARDFHNDVRFELPTHRPTADTLRAIKKIVPKVGRPPLMLTETLCQLRKIDSNNSVPIEEIISLLGPRLGMSRGLMDDAHLLLNELLTNAIDHSGRGECYVCAGRWGRSKFIHFTILDFGVGIPAKLRSMFKFDEDFTAVDTLLSRGLTTRVGREGGLGYQHVQDVMRRTQGRFSIYSGDAKAAYKYDRGEYGSKRAHRTFGGTCVDLAFNLEHRDSGDTEIDVGNEVF